MRKLDPEFGAHLTQTVTTICRCWRISRGDGLQLGLTEHDRPLLVDGFNFEPTSGLDASVAEAKVGLGTDNLEVLGALNSDHFTSQDIRANKYDHAKVESFVVNWSDPTQFVREQTYFIGEIVEEDGLFKATLETLPVELDQTKGLHFIRDCQASLGDTKCKIDLETPLFKASGTVDLVAGPRTFSSDGNSEFEGGWFDGGRLVWKTGANVGTTSVVSSHTKSSTGIELLLWFETATAIAQGDTYDIYAGCDKQFSTCKTKFVNALNFQGFPHLPGEDFALSYPANTTDMDGGIIVQ